MIYEYAPVCQMNYIQQKPEWNVIQIYSDLTATLIMS